MDRCKTYIAGMWANKLRWMIRNIRIGYALNMYTRSEGPCPEYIHIYDANLSCILTTMWQNYTGLPHCNSIVLSKVTLCHPGIIFYMKWSRFIFPVEHSRKYIIFLLHTYIRLKYMNKCQYVSIKLSMLYIGPHFKVKLCIYINIRLFLYRRVYQPTASWITLKIHLHQILIYNGDITKWNHSWRSHNDYARVRLISSIDCDWGMDT